MPDRVPRVPMTTNPTSKPWWASRTMWVNLASALLAIGLLATEGLRGGVLPVSPAVLPWALFGLAAVNILLRTVTSQPIGRPPPDDLPIRLPDGHNTPRH